MNINTNPLITVITVSFNAIESLKPTIQSVIDQNYKNYEYIVIDGGSTDGTLGIIKQYDKFITKWVSEKDDGVYDAMNKGLNLANGELINFLNAGDVYFPNSLDIVAKNFNSKFKLAKFKVVVENGIIRNEFASVMYFGRRMLNHQGLVYRKDVFDKNIFDNKLKIIGDLKHLLEFDLWKEICYFDETIVIYIGGGLATKKASILRNYFERLGVFKWKSVDLRVRIIVLFFAILGIFYNIFRDNRRIN